jgi:hypothetical protein
VDKSVLQFAADVVNAEWFHATRAFSLAQRQGQKEGKRWDGLRVPKLSNDTPFGEIEVATTC